MIRINLTCPCRGVGYVVLRGRRTQSRIAKKARKKDGGEHIVMREVIDELRWPCDCRAGHAWSAGLTRSR